MKKERDFSLNIPLLIICGVVFVIFGITIFFTTPLTYLLKLKPDLRNINNSALEVHFVDVGSADAILVKLPNDKKVIIDSGLSSYQKKLSYYINNVFFRNDKDKTFDYAILTHSDSDHSGNFSFILDNYTVKNFYRPQIYSKEYDEEVLGGYVIEDSNYDKIISRLNKLSNQNKINVMYNFAGAETDEIKDYLTFLTPLKEVYGESNMYSPYILLKHKSKSVLLTGDATKENEIELTNYYSNLNVDVLKIAHHGSSTSTSVEFLEYLNPKYAVISVGENNNNLPSLDTLNNIKNYSEDLYKNLYITKDRGNIIYYVNSDENSGFLTIKNVNSYVFVDYYLIALAVMGTCLTIVFFPKFKKKDDESSHKNKND